MQLPTRRLLGTGMLSWHPSERITGRYGTVSIFAKDLSGVVSDKPADLAVHNLIGQHGQLIAVHDGNEYLLGTGMLFVEEHIAGQMSVGVRPDNPKPDEEWLDSTVLEQLNGAIVEKSVELYFAQIEALSCEKCLVLVIDNKVCDECGVALCKKCRYTDEGIVFCFECFQERKEEYQREETLSE